jgi:hypothetical protein
MSTHHISTSIRGALARKDFARAFKGVFTDDNGKVMSIPDVKKELLSELAKGHELIPSVGCDHFDWVKGCLGHESKVNDAS